MRGSGGDLWGPDIVCRIGDRLKQVHSVVNR
jgi:hypothetical protein